jgi:hypothetical protein
MIAELKGKLPMTCPACEAGMTSISSLDGWMIATYACGSTYQDGRPPRLEVKCGAPGRSALPKVKTKSQPK